MAKRLDLRTEVELKGVRVRSTIELVSGRARLPKGTLFTIEAKYRGLDLESDPCASCGVQVRISRVPFSSVEEV